MSKKTIVLRSRGNRLSASFPVLCFSVGLACSPAKGVPGEGGGSGGGQTGASGGEGGTGSGGAPGTGAAGGAPSSGSGGLITGIPQGKGGSEADAACAGLVLEPEVISTTTETTVELNCTAEAPQPIAIYLVLDNSQSMNDGGKWRDAVDAITGFVRSDPTQAAKPWTCTDKEGNSAPPPSSLPPPPAPGTVKVAIQYFHPQQVGGGVDECNGSGHGTPAVTMGLIPATAEAIVNSLGATGPTGNTPTVGALTGGTQFCAGYQQANAAERCVVVLVTDGQPNGCGLSSRCNGNECVDPNAQSRLTPISGDAFTATNSVVTFTVGMSGVTTEGFGLLNAIALAGGSDCTPGSAGNEACNVTTGGAQAFLDALNTIRKSVQVTSASSQTVTSTTTKTTTLQCEWSIPKPSDGQEFQKDQVNVAFTTGGVKHAVGNVPDQAGCASTGGGWYYDVPDAPTRILTCSSTCTAIQASPDTKVSVQVGCATEPADPR